MVHLFKPSGENLPSPLSVTYAADADKVASERAQIAPLIAAKNERIDGLALLAEREDPDALAEIAALEIEIAELRKAERRKEHAERQLRIMAAQELGREQWDRDQHLRRKMAKKSADRLPPVKGIREAIKKLVGHLHQLETVNSAMFVAWQDTWSGKADALVFPNEVRQLIAHEIYTATAKLGMKFPHVKYCQDSDRWPKGGLVELYANAHDHVKAVMSGELPSVAVSPAEPEPVEPSSRESAPPSSSAVKDLGLDNFEALSGREWQSLQDNAARDANRIADGTHINPFDGSDI